MSFEFLFSPRKENKTIKDLVIEILGQQGGLSARKIYSLVKKTGTSVSYQAVYKTLKKLCSRGAVVKNNREYSLSMGWVEKIYSFSRRMKSKQSRKKGALENLMDMLSHRESVVLEFSTIMELDEFSKKLHDYFYPKVKDRPICMYFKHQWWHLLYPQKEYSNNENNNNFYMVCFGDTELDRHGHKMSKTRGFNSVLISGPLPCDTTVYGDIVVNTYFDQELSDAMQREFSSVKKLKQLHVPDMIKRVFQKKSRILVTVNRNKFAADRIREQTLSLFEEKSAGSPD